MMRIHRRHEHTRARVLNYTLRSPTTLHPPTCQRPGPWTATPLDCVGLYTASAACQQVEMASKHWTNSRVQEIEDSRRTRMLRSRGSSGPMLVLSRLSTYRLNDAETDKLCRDWLLLKLRSMFDYVSLVILYLWRLIVAVWTQLERQQCRGSKSWWSYTIWPLQGFVPGVLFGLFLFTGASDQHDRYCRSWNQGLQRGTCYAHG